MNSLEHESSPYLLQHAGNPVHWHPWGGKALDKAREEDKLLIVSIGYSSCHWCHVMEKESFEDQEVAELMNRHFVSIKIDREERPDIDQVYMTAVHMMHEQGGWPLNCIALPDGRPIWGGTYFPKEQWMHILKKVHAYYQEQRREAEALAGRMAAGIRENSLFTPPDAGDIPGPEKIRETVRRWSARFDLQEGGFGQAPKFPSPLSLDFLLHYGHLEQDAAILGFVETTLIKMARGGIYDQAGGGFARYAVDARWKVPHFEKMLYDNGQLLGLYAEAYQVFGRKEFLELLHQSLGFIRREMRSPEGLFYAALDADSQGEEGRFYTWSSEELEQLLGKDFKHFSAYFQVDERGLWENGRYILLRGMDPREFAQAIGMNPERMESKVREWQEILMEAREKRIRPGLDHKALSSWNALMISGLVKMYRATGEEEALVLARDATTALRELLQDARGRLFRSFTAGKAAITAFHIDYALQIQAALDLYEVSMDVDWLQYAESLTEQCMELFFDASVGMFLYNAADEAVLISHQVETQDGVLPSSNASMARNLFRLGRLMGKSTYLDLSRTMLSGMGDRLLAYPQAYALWGKLALMHLHPFYEIAVCGPGAAEKLRALESDYLPQAILAGSTVPSELPLFKGRSQDDKTLIFVCRNQVCDLPVEAIKDAQSIYL